MLKREIKYTDFNGDDQVEIYWFHLSKPELVDMAVEDGGLGNIIEKIVESNDYKEAVKHFKKILLLSYGEKSPDGKRFIKTEQLREEFYQSAAYATLFMELASDSDKAAEFIKGIIPADLNKEMDQDKPTQLPANN